MKSHLSPVETGKGVPAWTVEYPSILPSDNQLTVMTFWVFQRHWQV